MSLPRGGGRGGPDRPIGKGLGGIDPNELRPSTHLGDFLAGRNGKAAAAGAAAAGASAAAVLPQMVTVRPTGYWSLGILPSMGFTYVTRSWSQTYVNSGVQQIIQEPVVTPQSRFTIITGFRFWGIVGGYGGTTTDGQSCLLGDLALYGTVQTSFILPGGPSLQYWHLTTGPQSSAIEGRGRLNDGYDNSPIELFVPPNTPLRAQYNQKSAPPIEPLIIGFDFQGYEADQREVIEYVSGSKR